MIEDRESVTGPQAPALSKHGPPPPRSGRLRKQALERPPGIAAATTQASRNHPGRIQDQAVPDAQQCRQVGHGAVLEMDLAAVITRGLRQRDHQQPRRLPWLGGMIRDEIGVEIEVELVGAQAHGSRW